MSTEPRTFSFRMAATPVGELWLAATEAGLWGPELEPRWSVLAARLAVATGEDIPRGAASGRSAVLTEATRALARYFRGDLDALRSVPLDLAGSKFDRTVWSAVRRVRPGRTISYATLAERAGRPGAFRATGAANGRNPCALFVPCHRVVSSTGRLQGYGGGIRAKAFLLAHEGVPLDADATRLRRQAASGT